MADEDQVAGVDRARAPLQGPRVAGPPEGQPGEPDSPRATVSGPPATIADIASNAAPQAQRDRRRTLQARPDRPLFLARRAGVRVSLIRYCDVIGLLPAAERVSGQRRYDETALRRLAVIDVA